MGVKKALVFTTGRLQEFPPPEKTTYGTRPLESESSHYKKIQQPMPSKSIDHALRDRPSSLESERVSAIDSTRPRQEVVFRILCPNERVGSIIGKGGSIVKALQNNTGASISIGPTLAECNERVITITAVEVMSLYSVVNSLVLLAWVDIFLFLCILVHRV